MNVRWMWVVVCLNLGQLPIAMRPLLVTLLAADRTGSFAVAGIAGGGAALGMAATAPWWSRALTRFGHGRVLVVSAALFVGVDVLLANCHGVVPFIGLAVVSGLSTPPVASSVRAALPQLTGRDRLTRAYAVNAVALEIVYLVGPLWVMGWLSWTGPGLALIASASAGLIGILAGTSRLPPAPDQPRRRVGSLLRAPAVHTLGGTYVAYWICMGAMWVLVPSFATHLGRPGQSGLLVALWSAGSLLGGLVLAGRPPRRAYRDSYLRLLAVLTVTSAALLLPDTIGTMAAVIALFGVALAPWLAVNDRLVWAVGRQRAGELYGWLTTIGQIGSAAGSALAGPLADHGGEGPAFLVVTGALAVGLAIALIWRRTLPDDAGPRDRPAGSLRRSGQG